MRFLRACGSRAVVYADVMREPDTQRSKGCGIVEFDTPEAAANAIQTLNDTYLDGRLIFVREDREDHDLKGGPGGGGGRGRGAGGRGGGRGARNTKEVGRRLFVSNLDFGTSWQDLKDHFRQVGPVARADVMKDENNKSRGLGTVEMESPDDALSAISMLSNSELGGRQILVREDRQEAR